MRGGVWIARGLSSFLCFGIGFFFFLIWIVFGLVWSEVFLDLLEVFSWFGFGKSYVML